MPSPVLPPPDDLQRYRELTAPGRALNLFESTELADLEAHFGQASLFPSSPKTKPVLMKTPATSPAPAAPAKLTGQRQPDEQVQHVPLTALEPNPWNRKIFTEAGLAELTASVKAHGVIQPLIVRAMPPERYVVEPGASHGKTKENRWLVSTAKMIADLRAKGASSEVSRFFKTEAEARAAVPQFEIIAGERRWRAATAAQLERVPVIVRTATDRDLVELNAIENLQREDLDPIEEARGLARMRDEFGYTLDDLKQRLGLEKSAIYGKLKLAKLCDAGANLLRDGTINESIALRIARIPGDAQQKAALEQLENEQWGDEPITDRDAARIIAEHFMKELKGAPFDVKDATLPRLGGPDPKACGACTDCPLRAGNQPDFDPKAGRADVCLNPACYRARGAAHLERIGAKDKNALAPAGLFNEHGQLDTRKTSLREADRTVWGAEPLRKGAQHPTLGELAAKLGLPAKLAQDPDGDVHTLVDERAVLDAAKKAGLVRKSSSSGRNAENEWRRKQERERAIGAGVTAALLAGFQAKVTKPILAASLPAPLVGTLRFLVLHAACDASAEQARAICTRRGIDTAPFKAKAMGVPARDALEDAARKCGTAAQAIELLFDLTLTPKYPGYSPDPDGPLAGAAKLLQLELKQLEADAKAALDENKQPATKAEAPAAGLGPKILAALEAAFPNSLTIQQLVVKLQVPYRNVQVWLAVSGKKTKGLKKVGPATYTYQGAHVQVSGKKPAGKAKPAAAAVKI